MTADGGGDRGGRKLNHPRLCTIATAPQRAGYHRLPLRRHPPAGDAGADCPVTSADHCLPRAAGPSSATSCSRRGRASASEGRPLAYSKAGEEGVEGDEELNCHLLVVLQRRRRSRWRKRWTATVD